MNHTRNHAAPTWLLPIVVLALLILVGPLVGLLVSIPWARLPELIAAPQARQAFTLSLWTSVVSTAACIVLGLPLALWLRRLAQRFPRSPGSWLVGALQLLVYAPLVLSPVVSGLAMIFFWGRRGMVGQWLDAAGFPVAYSTAGVLLVQVFVALPFFVATTITALNAIPRQLEEAAATEGASRAQVMRHILLPLAAPGMATGAVLSFARALSEFGATVTFAGNIAGESRTIPLLVSLGLSSGDMDQALGACILLLGIYVLILGLVGIAKVKA